ncbi:MAG: hypothetical protein AB8G11_07455 [Saprospiraceae bacterium]
MLTTNSNKPILTSDLQSGEIQFYDNFLPAMSIGDYTIDIEQHIADEGLDKTFKRSHKFIVAGKRFRLNMQDIHSVYPPIDGQGDFENILPQVILNNKSLPWERTSDNKTPNLAILLFTPEELQINDWITETSGQANVSKTGAKMRTIAQIKNPENGFVSPELVDFSYENDDDNCLCIEISSEYFNEIVPRFEELSLLAHVKEVSTIDKTDNEINNWFSTVFANRLPQKNQRNIVHLVSLEGFTQYLKPRSPQIDESQKVRLVSLASWEFYCEEPNEEFEVVAKKLIENHQTLRLFPNKKINNRTIKTAIEGGYIPMKYETRQGEKTTAFYRSALTPNIVKNQHHSPNFSAESAMIYDMNTGIFDTSYSVAWQTGRLLALSESVFSKSLLEWKQQANSFLDTFFAKQNFYRKIVAIYNKQMDADSDKMLTLEELMSDDVTNQLLAATLKQSLSDLGFLSRGDIGGKRTIEELVNKAKEELEGLSGILTEIAFDKIKYEMDVESALVKQLFE